MDPKRAELLRKNKRRIFWTKLFIETKPLNFVLTLFYLSRGLELKNIFYLGIFWALTSFVLEIPTGYLADTIGRKRTLILGVLLYITGIIIFLLAPSFWIIALAVVFQSAAFSCFSGVDSALIYDSLKELGDEKSTIRVSGKYLSGGQFAKIFMPLVAAYIVKDLLPWQFNALLLIDLFFSVISLMFAFSLTEPNRQTNLSQKEIGMLKDAFDLFKKDSSARKLAFNKVLFFLGSLAFWKVYQPVLKDAGTTVHELAIVYSVMQVILFTSLWFSERIKKTVGSVNFMTIPVVLGLIGVTGYLFFDNKWVLLICALFPLSLGSVRDPIFIYQLNRRIKSFNRATTNSLFNFLRGLFDIPLSLLIGYLVVYGVDNVYYIVIGIFILCLTVLSIRKKDLIFETNEN